MLRYRRMSADTAKKDVEISSAATENQKFDDPINSAEGVRYDTMKQKPNRSRISTSSFQNDDKLVILKSQSASVSNYVDPVIPITLIHGVPDRIYFFSYNSGIMNFITMLEYLFFPTKVLLTARANYQPISENEIKVSLGDILQVVEHRSNGLVWGYNTKTDQNGLFPLECLTPRYDTQIILCDVSDRFDLLAKERNLIETAVRCFQTYLLVQSMDTVPNPITLMNIFNGPSSQIEECFISGPLPFIKQMKRKLETLQQTGFCVPGPWRTFETQDSQ